VIACRRRFRLWLVWVCGCFSPTVLSARSAPGEPLATKERSLVTITCFFAPLPAKEASAQDRHVQGRQKGGNAMESLSSVCRPRTGTPGDLVGLRAGHLFHGGAPKVAEVRA